MELANRRCQPPRYSLSSSKPTGKPPLVRSPRRVTGVTDPRAALVELKNRFGCSLVGMTIGAAGAVVYHEGGFIESPGFEAPGACRDTTGAGDAFHAGFLYGFLTGEDIEASMKLGNAVAAIKCSALGARTALPNKFELDKFLRNQSVI